MDGTVLLVSHAQATESPPPTILEEIEDMFLILASTQSVDTKLVDDQGIESPQSLASLSDKDIASICNVIRRSSS